MSDSNLPHHDALTSATQMVKNGRLDKAREILMAYLVKNPSSEQAWLLMSYVLSDPAKQKDCLERVLKINPNNTVAQSKLAHLLGRRTEELFRKKAEPAPAPEPEPSEPEPPAVAVPPPAAPKAMPPAPPPAQPVKQPIAPLSPVPEIESAPSQDSAAAPAAEKKKPFSGDLFRIITIVLIALIVIIAAVILYFGVISPLINSWLATPTPTQQPLLIPTFTFPPEWTKEFTPTPTLVPSLTFTPLPAIS
ncbi:MAG: hypothetical protein JW929_09075 [Anaerolineales bacterium]|nr:hypothetical protein [Anaerolineales bacterium]